MGRSRGSLTTKIYALVDANGLPVRIKLIEGQAHDGRRAADMLGELKAGQILLADRVNDSNALRIAMADQGAWANIRPTPHRVDHRQSALSRIATGTWSSASSTS